MVCLPEAGPWVATLGKGPGSRLLGTLLLTKAVVPPHLLMMARGEGEVDSLTFSESLTLQCLTGAALRPGEACEGGGVSEGWKEFYS